MLSRATRRATLAQIRHVAPVPPAAAPPLVARVYAQVERDFGMLAPPMSLHAPAPGTLAAAWLMLRETLLADGAAHRAVKEAVATAVSRANACPYCVDVHSATLHGLARRRDAAAIAEDRIEDIADPGVRGVARWARTSGNRLEVGRGGLPFVPELAPELLGVAVTFHYLNRMVNVFLTDSPFPPGLPDALRGTVTRVFGALLRPTAGTRRAPGRALDLLPDAPLPADLA
ncbi:MAG: carboxymuconolactone decarboxylase family protein, partial [Micromonospora sp.]